MLFAAAATTDSAVDGKPGLEYKASLSPGAHTLLVSCLPTQSTGSKGLLRYAIFINNEAPGFINIHTESESRALLLINWK